jgi:hypothetical protein
MTYLDAGPWSGPRTPEGLERIRRGKLETRALFPGSQAEPSRLRAGILTLRDLCH